MFGDSTIGVWVAAWAMASCWAGPMPVVPMTSTVSDWAASAAWRTEASGLVKSITASASANSVAASSMATTPSGSIPARVPMSLPSAGPPTRSVPPASVQPGVAAISRTSICPMRPAHPTTPIFIPASLGEFRHGSSTGGREA